MLKTFGLCGATLLLWGALAMAQSPDPKTEAVKPAEPSEYWLGIGCMPVPPTLRTQLNLPEKQGLFVAGVVPDSPAAKAGIALHDVLLRAGDKPLAVPRDLVRAIEAVKAGKLKIDLIHDGKPRTVEATPVKRPEEARGQAIAVPDAGDWETMAKWLEGMRASGEPNSLRPPMRFRLIHPGAIVPRDVLVSPPLPPKMSIVVSKEGDQPAKIAVKRGDQKWEVTEKELDKLPADVRPHVERMLGRGSPDIIGALGPFDVAPDADASGSAAVSPRDSDLSERMEKRFDEISRRMDKLLGEFEQLRERQGKQKPAEK